MPPLEGALFLIVGLGNPGKKYDHTPHNLGFEVLDLLASRLRVDFRKDGQSLSARLDSLPRKAILLKPQTFMNLSGNAVREVAHFFKVEPKDILVVSDDLDLPPGKLRLRLSGGAGGHNGHKSVIEQLGTDGYPRLRIGVGRLPNLPSEDYLLSKIPGIHKDVIAAGVVEAANAVEMILKDGITQAMNQCNRKDEVT